MSAMFLDPEDLVILTGRKMKTCQIAILRKMGIPFKINATGHPVVTRAAIEGRSETSASTKQKWTPNALKAG